MLHLKIWGKILLNKDITVSKKNLGGLMRWHKAWMWVSGNSSVMSGCWTVGSFYIFFIISHIL